MTKKKILTIDDAQDIHYLLKYFLTKANYEVEFAKSAKEGIEKFKSTRYDIVLLDISMPEIDGYQAIKYIRDHEHNTQNIHIPVIALTGHDKSEIEKKCLELGFTGVINKPITFSNIKDKIEGIQEDRDSTFFAPSDRDTQEEILKQQKLAQEKIRNDKFLKEITSLISKLYFIINENRQIIFLSEEFKQQFKINSKNNIGLRPGELFGCCNSTSPGGCSTSPNCSKCDAILSMIEALTGTRNTKKMNLKTSSNKTIKMDLESIPISINKKSFAIIALTK